MDGTVLITGGAGFLGRAIIKRSVDEQWPARIVVLSRDDAKHAALQKRWPHIETLLGDVGTMPVEQMTLLMRGFDTVIHAAASKYVDRSEHAAFDTVQTNVEGSRRVALAAIAARVTRVVGVSTDKAVAPLNNYGASKFLMERLFQEAARLGDTRFTVCRYGNVVASTGSVLAIFMALVAEGRPILLTHPGMTRFWMSPTEAVDTVLAALDVPSGTLIIPRCRAMEMHDVALTALGYEEHDALPEDGRVQIIGLRPGEKMHESLLQRAESVRAHSGFFAGPDQPPTAGLVKAFRYVSVLPPDVAPINEAPFEIVSNDPPGGWLGPKELREIVAESAAI